MSVALYGLLYIDEHQKSAMNLVSEMSFEQTAEVYIRDARLLSRSLASNGIEFTLLTNESDYAQDLSWRSKIEGEIDIQSIEFHLKVPHGIKFYATHYKLDVYRFFSSLEENAYVGLIDLDMVAIGGIPQCLTNIIKNKLPVCYDVSDQLIPAFGHEVIIKDLERFQSTPSEGRWCGGELLMGTPVFFASLCEKFDLIYEKYTNIYRELLSNNDEMLTSVALELLRKDGKYIADGGTLGIVGRYWSVPVWHPQKPFEYYKESFLLHLPSDKEFLSRISDENPFSRNNFIEEYEKHLRLMRKDSQVFGNSLYIKFRNRIPLNIRRFIKSLILPFYRLLHKNNSS